MLMVEYGQYRCIKIKKKASFSNLVYPKFFLSASSEEVDVEYIGAAHIMSSVYTPVYQLFYPTPA